MLLQRMICVADSNGSVNAWVMMIEKKDDASKKMQSTLMCQLLKKNKMKSYLGSV